MEHGFLDGTDLQRQTLRLYGELVSRQGSWAGKLVFACGEGVSATGLPAAVSLANGTTLALDPDAARVKRVFRKGGVDFVVNTLDEALRVLKNEIRKHRPLSVGLVAELQPVLTEMVERGVLPDLQVAMDALTCEPEVCVLEQAGMERLRLSCREGIVKPSEQLANWLVERGWSETVLEHFHSYGVSRKVNAAAFSLGKTPIEEEVPHYAYGENALEAATNSALRALDARLLESLPAEDGLRRTWLQRIGHYQRLSAGGVRILWLTEAERAVMKMNSAD